MHSMKLGIRDVALKNAIETRIQLTEIIESRGFWGMG
jgi:hypothetical protein